MKHYSVAEIEITDPSWVSSYVQNVTRLVESRGGRYLARTSAIEKLEGEREVPKVFLIIEWPSKEAAVEFYESEEYRPYLRSRLAGARTDLVLVPGEDVARLARISG